jgi:hypothetical protein
MVKAEPAKFRRLVIFLLASASLIILAGTAAWWKIGEGFRIGQLRIASVEISRLFVQYDRGLIIRIGRLDIPDGKATTGGKEIERGVSLMKNWGPLVREIEINRLVYGDSFFTLTYGGGKLAVRGSGIVMEARPDFDDRLFSLDISRLEIEPYNVLVTGTASYARLGDHFRFSGRFAAPWGGGELTAEETGGRVDAQINSERFSDLEGLLRQLPLDEEAFSWVAANISAESYRIEEVRFNFELGRLREFGPDNIRGTGTAGPAMIRFDSGLPPVRCEAIEVDFRDDRLTFTLDRPDYEGKSLAGSSVFIDNIIEPDSVLGIDIRAESMLDRTVLTLLSAYGISLPLKQHSGLTLAEVSLLFDLPEFDLQATGSFVSESGTWSWDDIPFEARDAAVSLRDDQVSIEKAEIFYEDNLRAVLSGVVDTDRQEAELVGDIEKLRVTARNATFLQAEKMRLPLAVDFSGEGMIIDMETIGTTLSLAGGETRVDIRVLDRAVPLMPVLQAIDFTEGELHFAFRDLSRIDFHGSMHIPGSILSLDNTPVRHFSFSGTRKPEQTSATVNDGHIMITIDDQVNISLREYLATVDFDRIDRSGQAASLPLPLMVVGPRTRLLVRDLEVPTRDFIFKVSGTETQFNAELEKGSFRYAAVGERMHLTGKGLDAGLAEKFIRFTDLSEGLINASLDGDAIGYNGYLEFSNVVIREYLLMNNILAFLNSIPALATLSEPGFDQDGYRVREGIVHFDLQDKLLTIRQLRMDGTTVNCEARGWMDFNNRTLHLNMELFTLKDYSKIINIIPWAGYAFLGEDGSLSTSLRIDGSLDDPEITTYITRDLIMSPVNILRRTIEWPFRILGGGEEKPAATPEREQPAPVFPY